VLDGLMCRSPTAAPPRCSRCRTNLLTPDCARGRIGSLIEIRALRALALAAAGDEPAAIAEERVISLDSAKEHVIHVLAELGAATTPGPSSWRASPA